MAKLIFSQYIIVINTIKDKITKKEDRVIIVKVWAITDINNQNAINKNFDNNASTLLKWYFFTKTLSHDIKQNKGLQARSTVSSLKGLWVQMANGFKSNWLNNELVIFMVEV